VLNNRLKGEYPLLASCIPKAQPARHRRASGGLRSLRRTTISNCMI
jgi:hypothetical protein